MSTAPLHGALSVDGATRTYTPNPNYSGPDGFSFRASDCAATSVPATVTINVAAVKILRWRGVAHGIRGYPGHDRARGQRSRRQPAHLRDRWGRLSADSRYVTTFTSAGTIIRDRFAGITPTPAGASTWLWPAISANGRYVVALDAGNGGRLVVTPNPL